MLNTLEREDLFDTAFLERLRMLALRLRKRRELMKRGSQSTPATGFTREFKDYRHYTPKEDYRAIDWRLYARLGKLFVRLYEETQELNLHILLDTSASMAKPHPEKRKQALRFAVALAYLGLTGQQRVNLHTMCDTVKQELPPLRGQGHMEKIMNALMRVNFGGVTDLERCFNDFNPGRQRYGVIFVISDFYGRDPETTPQAVTRASVWPGESHFVQIFHPQEREPDLDGEVELAEVETGERRRFWLTKRDVARYTEAFDAFAEATAASCASRQIDFVQCRSDDPFEERFLELLMRGALLGSV
ncbi:MAG: DUF58 domain-containing protein [Verrucomicrobiaceae bacterium]|nr:DUF58 domain-containing protein [Verrucomicrobiaceae bacterium]